MTENEKGRGARDASTPSSKVKNNSKTLAKRSEKENKSVSQPRYRWCAWIASPYEKRCPRWRRTGMTCWCDHNPSDPKWPWRVQPPLQEDPEAPAWFYDEYGPHPC